MVDLEEEWPKIRKVALMHGIDPLFICAVRKQENGDASGTWGEFGLKNSPYLGYNKQLEGCVKTLRTYLNEYLRNPFVIQQTDAGFRRLVYSDLVIMHIANRYAPVGALNDPTHLNENWRLNVANFYYAFTKRGVDITTNLEAA